MTPADIVCEVRVPTYRRQLLLERALGSLIAQTHDRWRAVVFDDCPEGSAHATVAKIGDPRIVYRHNEPQLGAIGNIDQCFRNRPFIEGAYACVVEDDNYLLPEHLRAQLALCRNWQVDVVFMDQRCEDVVEPGLPGVLSDKATVASMYREGLHEPVDMLPAMLFAPAFSNGGVFWRLGCLSDFEIGPVTARPGVQERARILRLKDRVYVSHTPTAVWRSNDPRDSHVSSSVVCSSAGSRREHRLKERWKALLERREVLELQRFGLKMCGLQRALAHARREPRRRHVRIENAFLLSGQYVELTGRSRISRLFLLLRGLAFRLLIPSRIVPPRKWAASTVFGGLQATPVSSTDQLLKKAP